MRFFFKEVSETLFEKNMCQFIFYILVDLFYPGVVVWGADIITVFVYNYIQTDLT